MNTTIYGLKSWRYAAAKHWNTLPCDISSMAGSMDFLKKIRQTDFLVNPFICLYPGNDPPFGRRLLV